MNRKAAAAGTNSKSSHPWVRRLSRFKSRFPRLLRTDYWRASRSRGLWTSLFGAAQLNRRPRRTAISTVVQVRRSSSRWKPAEC